MKENRLTFFIALLIIGILLSIVVYAGVQDLSDKLNEKKSSPESPWTLPIDAEQKTLAEQPILVDILWQGSMRLGRRTVIELPDDSVLVIDDQTSPPATDHHRVDPGEPRTRLIFEITHRKNATAISTNTPLADTNTEKRRPGTKIGNEWSSLTNGPKKSVGYRWWVVIRPNERNSIVLTDDTRLVFDGRVSLISDRSHPNDPKELLFLEVTRTTVNPQIMKTVNGS